MIRPPPIRGRLIRMSLMTSAAVLIVTIGALFAYQVFHLRRLSVRQLHVLSQTMATNSAAALAFDDAKDATRILEALKAEPHIQEAVLFDARGRLFARYARQSVDAAPRLATTTVGYRFEHGYLSDVSPVTQGGDRLGTLYVRADLTTIYQSMELYALIAAAVAALAVVVAYFTANQLQRRLSQPILQLAELARVVSDRQDYNVRAGSAGTLELDRLAEAFNYMLVQVQRGEQRLLTEVDRLNLLRYITRAVADHLDLRNIFKTVLRSLEENLPIYFGCVLIYSAVDESLAVSAVGPASSELDGPEKLSEGMIVPVDQSGLARCVGGQLVYERDIRESSLPLRRRLSTFGVRSLVLAPLLVERQVFGVLVVGRRSADAFSDADCEFLKQLSEHVALASHQARLYTALREAYDELQRSQNTIVQQERLRALGQMASGIAHDINNAISPASIYTDILLRHEGQLSDRARSLLTIIGKTVQDVAATVARMREFYRQREPQLTLALIDANRVVREVIELTKPRWFHEAQRRGVDIELKTELATEALSIMGAEVELRDGLTNLIFNAVDAMPDGGTLTLRTLCSGGSGSARRVIIEVGDSGVGMSEETRRRCLEPFFTTKGERGTGLGLAIVYGMIKRHSAEMEIQSKEGRGTTVRLNFLAQTPVLERTSDELAAPMAGRRRLRILLVDDDPLVVKSLRDALELDGHVVTAVHGGQAGIEAFASAWEAGRRFSIVLTDLGMPHVDGRKVAAAIKELSSQTPIILLTGWGDRLRAEGDVPPEVDRLLSKPPRLPELRAALEELA